MAYILDERDPDGGKSDDVLACNHVSHDQDRSWRHGVALTGPVQEMNSTQSSKLKSLVLKRVSQTDIAN